MKKDLFYRCLSILAFFSLTLIFSYCKKDDPYPVFVDQGSIASDGGTVKTDDGASVEIPPNALSSSNTISITNVTPEESDSNPGYKLYELKPDGLIFHDSITITLPFDDEYIDLSNKEDNYGIRVSLVKGSDLINLKAEIDLINKVARVKTTHFSDYLISFRSQWAEYYEDNKDAETKILSVPYYEQEENWCFYYSLNMITKYAGYSYKAPFYASLFGETYPETTGFIGGLGLDEADLLLLKGLGISYDYKILWSNINNLFGYILYNLDKNKPVEILSNKEGHAIVVVGHDQTGLFVNNPNLPVLMRHYTYEYFEEYWVGTKTFDFCNTLIINSLGNESRLAYTINFYENDLLIKESQNSEDSIGFLDINGAYATDGYSIVDIRTSRTGSFDGSDYVVIKPHLSNSESSPKNCNLHLKIDNKDITGSPQAITLPENRANYYRHNSMIFRLSNLQKGKHKITVELRSLDSYTIYDYWNFEINIANEFIDNGHSPNTPSLTNPGNGESGVRTATTLSWSCSDPDSDPLTYDVYFGSNENALSQIISNSASTSISRSSLNQGATYFWRVVARDNHGNSTTGPVWRFTIGTAPVVDFTYSPNPVIAGQTVQFTDRSSSNTTGWEWDFGDGSNTSNVQNPTHRFNSPGTYEVNLRASNVFGWSVASTRITVNADVSVPVANFTASQTTIQAGGTITFTDQSTNNPTSWSWNFGDGGNSTSRNPFHTYSTAGTYTVTLTATNSAGSDIETNNITVSERCIPLLISPENNAELDNSCTLNGSDISDNISWFFDWNDCAGATRYNLYVIGRDAIIPAIDIETQSSEYSSFSTGSYIGDLNGDVHRIGWRWRVRAFVNGEWGEWSNERTFDVEPLNTDCQTETVTDIDGNVYNTVTIGTQIWMAENLATTRYSDGTSIPLVTENSTWGNLLNNNTVRAYCYYNNNTNGEKDIFGALYTWAAAMNGANSSSSNPSNVQGVCPLGWHLPSDAEWSELSDYLIINGYGYEGSGTDIANALAANQYWENSMTEEGETYISTPGTPGYDLNSNNSSGFFALPSGRRLDTDGVFDNLGYQIELWTSTEVASTYSYVRTLGFYLPDLIRDGGMKSYGFSVRCIKD